MKTSFFQRAIFALCCAVGAFSSQAKAQNSQQTVHLDPSGVSTAKIYIPQELKEMDLYDSSSKWYYGRSKQSEHFILFWGKEYGETGEALPDQCADEAFRVNTDDLLAKAEKFYATNVNTLGFVKSGSSKTDRYKMMIFLIYQKEWLATGAGYDDTIGALWVSPATCRPVGSVIAHEIGHCFQYQTFSDLGGKTGWRYGFGGGGGNGYWEQCAQWQSFQDYPQEAMSNYYFKEYITDCNLSTFHEEPRYSNYFINYFWAYKHGVDFIGRLWRESGAKGEEDPAQAYMRINKMNLQKYNDEQFEYACRMATWDLDALRDYGKSKIGIHKTKLSGTKDGFWQVMPESCPENHGYNVIRLEMPQEGTVVSAHFVGLAGTSGYRAVNTKAAGWRYGFVALRLDGSRVYGEAFSKKDGVATFTVPEGSCKLWFVVLGAPTKYWAHAWDDKSDNDEQWPYKVAFTNTNLDGAIKFGANQKPHDETFDLTVKLPADAQGYASVPVDFDVNKLYQALVLGSNDIAARLGKAGENKSLTLYGVNPDGSLAEKNTASGIGHWFDANGNVCSWSGDENGSNRIFCELDLGRMGFNIGQHPGRNKAGSSIRFSQQLVYKTDAGQTIHVTFRFAVTFE